MQSLPLHAQLQLQRARGGLRLRHELRVRRALQLRRLIAEFRVGGANLRRPAPVPAIDGLQG